MFLGHGFWFAVQVISRTEKRVAMLLEQQGYQVFVPTYKIVRKWSDRNKTLDLPLFPGYVFCRLEGAISGLILLTPGVLRIVSSGGRPSPISKEEIEYLLRVIASGTEPIPCRYLRIGQRVKIVNGLLSGVCGILVQKGNQRRVVILVETIMKAIAVSVDGSEIAPVPAAAVPSGRLEIDSGSYCLG